jgi:hypothetical protein
MDSASSSRALKVKTKGRGHTEVNQEGKYDGRDGVFESIGRGGDGGPLQCKQFDKFVALKGSCWISCVDYYLFSIPRYQLYRAATKTLKEGHAVAAMS